MPYKTKFRRIDLPEDPKDWSKPAETDANSMRSWGAATYRHFVRMMEGKTLAGFPTTGLGYARSTYGLFDDVISKIESGEAFTKLSPVKTQIGVSYLMQGVLRAAKEDGDAATAEYVSRRLAESLKSKD